MKKIIALLITVIAASLSVSHAQSGWKKNSAGHDVYVYKPERIPVYKPPTIVTSRKTKDIEDKKTKANTPAEKLNGFHPSKKVAEGIYYGYYEGNWVNNMREGKGKFTFDYGIVYDGDWKANEMDGEGIYTTKAGDVYHGALKKGKFNGQGTYKFPSGNSYTGSWVAGKREGYGVFKYSDGTVYEGGFLNDKFYGQGNLTYNDGTGRKGLFTGDNTDYLKLEYFEPASRNLVGKQVKNFVLETSDYKDVSVASFRGKYVLITFWSLSGDFDDAHGQVANALKLFKQKGFRAFSIAQYEMGGSSRWEGQIEEYKPTWPQAYAHSIDDIQKSYFDLLARPYCSNILVDPKGKIIAQNLFEDGLIDALKKVFKKK